MSMVTIINITISTVDIISYGRIGITSFPRQDFTAVVPLKKNYIIYSIKNKCKLSKKLTNKRFVIFY